MDISLTSTYLASSNMLKKDCLQKEGDTSTIAVKQEMIIIKEEFDETDAAPDLDDSKDLDDPLEINEKERELFIKEEKAKEEPEVVIANRGGPGLVYQGYIYTRYYMYKQKLVIGWRCQQYLNNCRGSLDTNLKCKAARLQRGHNHPPDYDATETAKLKHNHIGHQICNFFRKDGTFVIPYKENAKKKLKARNPFGIYNTLHCWQRPVKSHTKRS